MLGLSLAETAVILAVTLLVVGPKELPTAIRGVAKILSHMRELAAEFRRGLDELTHEAQIKQVHDDITTAIPTIIDLDGKPQKTYDISTELQEDAARRATSKAEADDGKD